MAVEYFGGIDVGSMSTEAVIVDSNGRLIASEIMLTGLNGNKSAAKAMKVAREKADLGGDRIAKSIATGYGRAAVTGVNKQVTEITCHAAGTKLIFPDARTVIDIGGQDSKVIHMDENGQLIDFAMNDKCAAGTGRFLEVMARRLEVDLDKLGDLALLAEKAVPISSTCTVFAESEVVSLIAQNHPRDEIIRGLHVAIINRIVSQVQTVGIHEKVSMSGGGARNIAVVSLLSENLGQDLLIHSDPQIIGALGAAVLASKL